MTVQTNPTPPEPLIRLPMWKLSFCLVAAPKLSLYTALGVIFVLEYMHRTKLWDERLRAEFWASVCLYAGVLVGLLFLWPMRPRTASNWTPLLIAGAVVRTSISTSLATLILPSVPEHRFFWTVFIIASVCVCVVEFSVTRRALRSRIRLAGVEPRTDSRAA